MMVDSLVLSGSCYLVYGGGNPLLRGYLLTSADIGLWVHDWVYHAQCGKHTQCCKQEARATTINGYMDMMRFN